MATQRIEYIDYLRGLCVTWVVWYHTTHPAFVDYSFRIPLFFFASGIFFKPYPWPIFWRKKFNQLIVPFVLFYLIYYVFLIVTNALSNQDLGSFDYSCFFQIFGLYRVNETFVVNPPLWFICALIDLQLLLYVCSKYIHSNLMLLFIASCVSLVGLWIIQYYPTPFMFGRSLRFFIYYATGYVLGKPLLKYLEESPSNELVTLFVSLSLLSLLVLYRTYTFIDPRGIDCLDYIEIFMIIILLILFFKRTYHFKFMYPLKYFGMNSYIVFGMHEVYHTSYRIVLERLFGDISIAVGCLQTILTLLTLWPTIYLLNKHIPSFVAKKDLIHVPVINASRAYGETT